MVALLPLPFILRDLLKITHRFAGPMLRVNCGAIPKDLVDSELFGHERGSFTGATATRLGWFERAGQARYSRLPIGRAVEVP